MSAEYCTGSDFGRPLEMKRKLQGVRRSRYRRRHGMANDAVLQGTVGTARGNQEPGGLTSPSKNARLGMWPTGRECDGQGLVGAGVIRRGAARPAPAAPPWDPASPLFFEKEMDKGCFVNERSQYLIENKGSASENEPKTNPNRAVWHWPRRLPGAMMSSRPKHRLPAAHPPQEAGTIAA